MANSKTMKLVYQVTFLSPQDRLSSKRWGWVSLYVKFNLRPQLMTPPTSSPLFVNLIAWELLSNSVQIVLVLACRSPNTPPTNTTTLLCALTKLITHRFDYYLFGYFNCSKIDWATYLPPLSKYRRLPTPRFRYGISPIPMCPCSNPFSSKSSTIPTRSAFFQITKPYFTNRRSNTI